MIARARRNDVNCLQLKCQKRSEQTEPRLGFKNLNILARKLKRGMIATKYCRVFSRCSHKYATSTSFMGNLKEKKLEKVF